MKKYKEIKILIIEDDLFSSMTYKNLLSDIEGFVFDLTFIENFIDGINALNSDNFDALLLDLNLPDSNCNNTINKIQEISSILPIIIMTGSDDEITSRKTITLGCQDYLVKSEISKKLLTKTILFSIERFKLKTQIIQEKKKSDKLLLNILPKDIADELKIEGKVKPKIINDASVLFTDFKNFTKYSEIIPPEQLVMDLNNCFSAFDIICDKYNIEKIKTIGDSYMAVGGLINSDDYTKNVILAALEMIEFINRGKEVRISQNLPFLEMRIGINNGPIIAGVVGLNKFQYDIWGDTVNLASRVESHGLVNKVNISQSTLDLIKNEKDFIFNNNGNIELKGKGKHTLYYVEYKKP